jgi:hypothetical protein
VSLVDPRFLFGKVLGLIFDFFKAFESVTDYLVTLRMFLLARFKALENFVEFGKLGVIFNICGVFTFSI